MTDFWTTADEIPALPGAYVLAISLSKLVMVSICREPPAALAPGCYLYCGSAKGPGGLAARLARHMRHGKAIRWHVDGLSEAGTVLGAWTFPGGDECDLVAAPFTLASADRRLRKQRLLEVQEPFAARRSRSAPSWTVWNCVV